MEVYDKKIDQELFCSISDHIKKNYGATISVRMIDDLFTAGGKIMLKRSVKRIDKVIIYYENIVEDKIIIPNEEYQRKLSDRKVSGKPKSDIKFSARKSVKEVLENVGKEKNFSYRFILIHTTSNIDKVKFDTGNIKSIVASDKGESVNFFRINKDFRPVDTYLYTWSRVKNTNRLCLCRMKAKLLEVDVLFHLNERNELCYTIIYYNQIEKKNKHIFHHLSTLYDFLEVNHIYYPHSEKINDVNIPMCRDFSYLGYTKTYSDIDRVKWIV